MPLDLERIDLGSFGVTEREPLQTPEIEPDQGVGIEIDTTRIAEDTTRPLRASMEEAVKEDPNQQAKLSKLSRDSGVPEFAIQGAEKEIETDLKLRNINLDEMSKRSPGTARYMTDFNNAVLAHDDVPVLEKLEKVVKDGMRSVPVIGVTMERGASQLQRGLQWTGAGFTGMGESIKTGWHQQLKGMLLSGADRLPTDHRQLVRANPMAGISEFEAQLMSEKVAADFGIYSDGDLADAQEAAVNTLAEEIRVLQEQRAELMPDDLHFIQESVRAGIESLGLMAPAYVAMAASGGRAAPLLMTIGAQVYTEQYGRGRSEGLTPDQANWHAGTAAGIEVVFSSLPTVLLSRMVTGQAGAPINREAMKFMVAEMGAEQLITLSQTMNDLAWELDHEMQEAETLEEKVQIQLYRQALTAGATLVAGGGQALGATGIAKAAEKIQSMGQAQEQQTQDEQMVIDEINELATESALRERDPEAFERFMQELTEDGEVNVFIDGVQASLYLGQFTPEQIAADSALTALHAQATEAADLGGDVVVSAAEFATVMAGTEHFDAMRPHMRMSPDTVTPFRQEQAQTERERHIESLMAEARQSASIYVEAQEIYNSVREQLIDTGVVAPEHASAMAQLVPAWATVYAARNNVSVKEAFERSGLNIEGPMTGRMDDLQDRMDHEQAAPDAAVVADPAEFQQRLAEAKEVSPKGAFVAQYDVAEYQGMETYLLDNGMAGFAVREDGDLVSVFKHPGSSLQGALDKIVPAAIDAGATKLDAFDGFLVDAYKKYGFVEVNRVPWDDQYAPADWNYEADGRPDVVFMELQRDGQAFKDFFARVTRGEVGVPSGQQYAPEVLGLRQQIHDNTTDFGRYHEEYTAHKGHFDDHIALSIPGYRDYQYGIGQAIIKTFPEGAVMLDIGASEGTQAKTITSLSGGAIRTISLDPNPSMAETFASRSQVEGAEYSMTALSTDAETGVAWTEDDGTVINWFDAEGQQFDIVQESMVFQFISPERDAQIARVRELTTDDGVAIIQEKVFTDQWDANERFKNENYKSRYFSKQDMDAKATEVLEGMNRNMVPQAELEAELRRNFNHVEQIWDAGNFKGYAASNNPETLARFTGNLIDLRTPFDTRTPRFYQEQQATPGLYHNALRQVVDLRLPQWTPNKKQRKAAEAALERAREAANVAREALREAQQRMDQEINQLGAQEGVTPEQVIEVTTRHNDEEARLRREMVQKNKDVTAARLNAERAPAARGEDIWAKVNSLGIKKEELEWLGLEEFLTFNPDARFTRDEVMDYINQNGVHVEVITADITGDTIDDHQWNWSESIDEDASNWEGIADNLIDDYKNTSFSDLDELDWLDVGLVRKEINEFINMDRSDLPDEVVALLERRDELQFPASLVETRDYATERQSITDELMELVYKEDAVIDAIRDSADEHARELYMDDPVIVHTDSETDLTIVGNDDLGYMLLDQYGRAINTFDPVRSFSEAEIQLLEFASDHGLIGRADAPNVARWEDYVTGDYSNYREVKFTLPDIEGDFYNDTHFEDRNIVAFSRVTDRNLIASTEGVTRVAENVSVTVEDNTVPNAIHGRLLTLTVDGEVIHQQGLAGFDEATAIEQATARLSQNGFTLRAGRDTYTVENGQLVSRQRPQRVRAYHLDEHQSDWHQAGRQAGYKRSDGPSALDLMDQEQVLRDQLGQRTGDFYDQLYQSNADLALRLSQGDRGLGVERVAGIIDSYINDGQRHLDWPDVIEHAQTTDIIPETKRLSSEISELSTLRTTVYDGVVDAPFKGDAWINLGLKRALIDAVDNGYDAVSWANSEVMVDRWSASYRTLYETQYDTKMPSLMKKLTKQTPKQFDFDGSPIEKGDQVEGYWVVEITPELREQIRNEGLPLFQDRPSKGHYDPVNSLIRLNESADLSTFLHEFAHFMYEMELQSADSQLVTEVNNWYRRNAEALATEAATYENTTVTPEQVNDYLKYQITGDTTRDAAIRRAVHENFARGFEQYLMEGKAPSIELRNAFRAFARWLSQIYERIRGGLRVNLDPEMRAVFDRLLATDEQLAAAAARDRFEPLFTDATMAGMTQQEFDDYQRRQEKVKDIAHETLRERLIKQLTRQNLEWWKDQKADIMEVETARLREEPVYRAMEVLRGDELKLDRAVVRDIVGETVTDRLGRTSNRVPTALRGMTATGQQGVHPDVAAAFLGYDSGAQMIDEIMTAQPLRIAADRAAEAIMVEQHGDIMNDGTIEQRADEALRNEERGKLILQELAALTRGTNQRAIDRQTIQDLAQENIGKLNFRQLHPGKYRSAEIRAAQDSARALAEGNRDEAARAKSRQALNHYLAKAAQEARDNTMKVVDQMGRYRRKPVREAIMSAGEDYMGQIDKILTRFEFRKAASIKQVDQRNQSIQSWMEERVKEDGDGLVISPAVLDESYVTHWKNVPFADLKGIGDTVRNIEHVARYANKVQVMEDQINFNTLVDRWVTHMDQMPTVHTPQRTDVTKGRNFGKWAMAQMTKTPWLASWLDGGERTGLSHDLLVQPFTTAINEELALWKQYGTPVMDAINNRSREDKRRHAQKLYIPELKDGINDGHLMGHQVLAVALNTGNQGNLRKMLLGEGWANPEVEASISMDNPTLQAVLRHMTRDDWNLVQTIWDQMDQLYPRLAEVHRETTGLVPPKVEATPVQTEFGTFRGGYYPVKYDPNRSHKASMTEEKALAEADSMFSQASIQASVNAGATNERTGFYDPIRLSLDVVPAHFQEVIHYVTHHQAVRQTNRLIRNKKVADAMKAKIGPEEFSQLKPWLNDIAKDGREAPSKMFWDAMLQRLRFGTTLGVMGFKASTGIIQISGLSNSAGEVGTANMMQAFRSVLGSVDTMRGAWEFANEHSEVMNHRMQTMDREIRNAMMKLEGKSGLMVGIQSASMKHIAMMQTYVVDLPTWHGAYIKGMKEWGDEQRAYRYADWVVESVGGSGLTKDLARIQRNQTETGKMFTMFMTFFSSMWNAQRDVVRGARSKRYNWTDIAARLMFIYTVPVLFDMIVRDGFLIGDDEEPAEQAQKFLTEMALYSVTTIPFVRDVASGSIGDFGYNMSPIAQLIEGGTRSIPELARRLPGDDDTTKGQWKAATKFAGAATGVPGVGQMWATGEHLWDVIEEGEDFTLHQFLFGPERD